MSLADNRTQLQDCDATGDVSGDSDASPQSRTTESGLLIEGPSAIQFQVNNTGQEHILFDLDSGGSTFSIDTSDMTLYIAIKDNLQDSFANLGAQLCLNDGADGAGGDDIGYNVAGVDVSGLPYQKKYASYKLDVSVVVAAPGTVDVDFTAYNGVEANLDHTTILQVGYGSIHLAKAQGTVPNAWFDGIYYIANDSFAATVGGGTSGIPETMPDLVGDDESVGACLFSNPIADAFYIFGPTEWGNAISSNSGFEGVDQQWYYLGDNGGGHIIGATHFNMRLVGNATGTNAFRQTRVTNINTGARANFDWSDANFDEIELDSTAWIDFGVITCPAQDAAKFCNASSFSDCGKMIVSSMDMNGNTWNGSVDADGAIIWDGAAADPSNQDNSRFNSDGTGNAIEVNPTGAGPFVYNIDGYTFDGYASQAGTAADRVFFINPVTLSADVTINLTNSQALNPIGGGSDFFSHRDVGSYTGTLIIQATVTLTVTVTNSAGNALEGISVRIENNPAETLITDGTTNSSGVFTDSFNFSSDTLVDVVVRKKGFKSQRITTTITADGVDLPVVLVSDPSVNLP